MLAGSVVSVSTALPATFAGPPNNFVFVLCGLVPAFAYALIFWRRSRLPVVPAAMAAIATVACVALTTPEFSYGDEGNLVPNTVTVVMGIATLFWAAWWDLTDVRRETERSQVAFWLHCCAGFFICRGSYGLVTGHVGLDENYAVELGLRSVWPFVLIFSASVLVSLVLDRRSLLLDRSCRRLPSSEI